MFSVIAADGFFWRHHKALNDFDLRLFMVGAVLVTLVGIMKFRVFQTCLCSPALSLIFAPNTIPSVATTVYNEALSIWMLDLQAQTPQV